MSAWDQFLDAMAADAPVKRPTESITAEEFGARFGYSASHSRRLLADKVKSGEMAAVVFLSADRKRAKCYVRA